ncbi:MAG TPA: SpoIIE family protein phosphatase [Polyangia bacterium]
MTPEQQGRKHLSAWLSVAQALPGIVDVRKPIEDILPQVAHAVAAATGIERVRFFTCTADTIRLVDQGTTLSRTLRPETMALLQANASGLCNRPLDRATEGLGQAVGLESFMWSRMGVAGQEPWLVVLGFENQPPAVGGAFDESDLGQLVNLGRQLGVLLKNRAMVAELEREKRLLAELNEDLEQRIVDRAKEFARVNTEISRALALLREKERRLKEDLEQARTFQQTLLPALPVSSRLAFDALYRPVEQVGGDLYDVFEFEPGHYRILVADATGHGVQASLRTIVLKSEYDQLKAQHAEPRDVLGALNRRLLARHRSGDMLCTACCVDIQTRGEVKVRHASAGHPAPIHTRADGVEPLHLDSPLMGASVDVAFPQAEIQLAADDWLVLYSDGISEQLVNGRVFDFESAILSATRRPNGKKSLLRQVLDEFISFLGPDPVEDDIVLISAHLLPSG